MGIGLETGGEIGRTAGMGDMGVEEAGDGEVEVDEADIEVEGIEGVECDYDTERSQEKGSTTRSSWLLRYIITLLFEPLMIPYWDGGYMGRNPWFASSVIEEISISLWTWKKK